MKLLIVRAAVHREKNVLRIASVIISFSNRHPPELTRGVIS